MKDQREAEEEPWWLPSSTSTSAWTSTAGKWGTPHIPCRSPGCTPSFSDLSWKSLPQPLQGLMAQENNTLAHSDSMLLDRCDSVANVTWTGLN